jgi:hypothetical protein
VYTGADGNGDGQITQLDYDVWKSNFGQTLTPAAASASSALFAAASSEDTAATSPNVPSLNQALETDGEMSTKQLAATDAGFASLMSPSSPALVADTTVEHSTRLYSSADDSLLLLLGEQAVNTDLRLQEGDLLSHEEVFSEELHPANAFLNLEFRWFDIVDEH